MVILKRIVAFTIDYFVFFTALLTYLFQFGQPDADGLQSVSGLMALPILIFWLFWFPFLESKLGYTVGKGLLDLKVQKNDKKVPFSSSLLRHVFDGIDFQFFIVMLIVALVQKKQFARIGDLVAGTTVVDAKKMS
jgi:uncharacterized RDD family membrane protein YckC